MDWRVDAPLHKYADDLMKIVIADPGDSLPTFLDKLRMIGLHLDEALARFGDAQIPLKTRVLRAPRPPRDLQS
eukprot:3980713-Pyramimonas_sp.AAC.1